ncbi:SDR family NAD(P)-dependent oxidoreductase [Zavarzinia sp.]|uniref:SDR family NAD(P)-dependent oxidoreductase n=1 Tax=Zavarzinia sp. TaxID=2027920 RepID=UPI00356706D9
MTASFEGRRVLVTGAASGIGLATALAFARRGAWLVVSDIDAGRLTEAARRIRETGARCLDMPADVSSLASMQALAERVHAETPALDILVNNAGIGYLGGFDDTPDEAWRRVLDINLLGVVNGCRVFLPAMRRAGGPRRVVNVASLAGIAALPNMSAYAASKHAVMGLSEGLALELELAGSAVGVTTVCPGIVNTAITKNRANVAAAIDDRQLARLQAYYEAQGVAPEVVAEALVEGVAKGRRQVLVGPFAKPIALLRRFAPALARRALLHDARKAGYL